MLMFKLVDGNRNVWTAYNGKNKLLDRFKFALKFFRVETCFPASLIALEPSPAANKPSPSSLLWSNSSSAAEVCTDRACPALLIGSRGRMTKKLMTMTAGRQDEASSVVRTEKPHEVVARA